MSDDLRQTRGIVAEASGVAPALAPDDPLFGVWRIVEIKGPPSLRSSDRRYGVRALQIEDFDEWHFAAEGLGLRVQGVPVAGDAERRPTVSSFTTLDGRPWADPFGPAYLGQLVQHWRLDPHLSLRLLLDNVVPPTRRRWTMFEIADDARIMTATSWDDGSPDVVTITTLKRAGEIRGATASAPGEWRIGDLTLHRLPSPDGRSGDVLRQGGLAPGRSSVVARHASATTAAKRSSLPSA